MYNNILHRCVRDMRSIEMYDFQIRRNWLQPLLRTKTLQLRIDYLNYYKSSNTILIVFQRYFIDDIYTYKTLFVEILAHDQ